MNARNNCVEFDEIRPYHDEELPQVYEELIADPAFRHSGRAVMPGVPFEALAQKMRQCKTKLEFQKNLCYGLFVEIGKESYGWTDFGPYRVAGRQVGGVYLSSPIIVILFSTPVSVHSFGRPGYGYRGDSHRRQSAYLSVD